MEADQIPSLVAGFHSVNKPQEFHVDWAKFYAQALVRGRELRARTRHKSGLRYGDAPAQVLNIFYPAQPRSDGLVYVFMHGGAFSEGHPDLCDYVGERLVDQGIHFVSMGYRVSPTRFPESAGDVAKGLAFLDAQLHQEGLSLNRYCLSGHSSGASIAALLGVRPDLLQAAGMRPSAIESMVLFSGIYDFNPPDPGASFVDPALRNQASPLLHCKDAPKKTLLIYGDPEVNRKANSPDIFKVRALQFEGALRSHGHAAIRISMPEADHIATALAMDDDAVFSTVMGVLVGSD